MFSKNLRFYGFLMINDFPIIFLLILFRAVQTNIYNYVCKTSCRKKSDQTQQCTVFNLN